MSKVYFLSDIHLGARYIDDPRKHESRIVEMLEAFGKDASHIYLLGDVLDYWFEYKTVVPRGYVRFFGALARLVDSGVKVTWIVGNHDIWLFDYLRDEIGIEIVDGAVIREMDGKKFYLAHGDALGRNLTAGFRIIRSVFRSRLCQKLYAAIHPRWTVPFAYRWSAGSRKKNAAETFSWIGDDREPAMLFAKDYLAKVDPAINYFVMGHRHIAVDRTVSPTCRLVILGECYSLYSYAVWDGRELYLKHFESKDFKFNKI